MATLEDAILTVYRRSLVENKKTVTLEDENFPVRSTAKRKLKQIDFQFEGRDCEDSNRTTVMVYELPKSPMPTVTALEEPS